MAISTKILPILGFFFIVGCGTSVVQYPTSIPSYNVKEAADRYQNIREAKSNYQDLNMAFMQIIMQGVEPTEDDKAKMYLAVDKYLFWSAVATIQLFDGNYTLSDQSVEKSLKGLEEYKEILKTIITRHSL